MSVIILGPSAGYGGLNRHGVNGGLDIGTSS